MYSAGIFMDLSKAFDTINHEYFLINCIIMDLVGWLVSKLLVGQKSICIVQFKNIFTFKCYIRCTSGLHIRPAVINYLYERYLFNIKVVIIYSLCWWHYRIYSDLDINKLHDVISTELEEVSNWFKCYKLYLNSAKTNLMFLGTAHQTTKMINNALDIYLEGWKSTRVPNLKFLVSL